MTDMRMEQATHTGPGRAVILVDCQNDFCEGGSLAVEGGSEAVKRIAAWMLHSSQDAALFVATKDNHIDPGQHFSATPDFVDSWPPHCVAGTFGAEFHSNLDSAIHRISATFHKGHFEPAYSGFEGILNGQDAVARGTKLAEYLRTYGIERVEVVGLATDYCVRATCIDAVANGFSVRLYPDLCASVDPSQDGRILSELQHLGVEVHLLAPS